LPVVKDKKITQTCQWFYIKYYLRNLQKKNITTRHPEFFGMPRWFYILFFIESFEKKFNTAGCYITG